MVEMRKMLKLKQGKPEMHQKDMVATSLHCFVRLWISSVTIKTKEFL
jgi:ribosomal protein L28